MSSDQYYQVIQQLRRTSGLNAKKAFLGQHPELKNILRTTYDPFTQFDLKVTENWQRNIGRDQFSSKTNRLLNALKNREVTGNRAKNAVRSHMDELTYESAQVLMLMLNKSLDIGLAAKSINEVFPGLIPTHDIQLAKAFDTLKCRFPCITSPKLDGLRAVYKNGQFYSRQGHIFRGLNALEQSMMLIEETMDLVPQAGYFDGELMVDGEHFNEISGSIRSFKETDNAHYYIFDAPSQLPLHKRIAFLHLIALANPVMNVTIVPHFTVTSLEDIMDYDAQFRDEGYEGSIVKQENAPYQNARTWDWMKIKSILTEDCIITGVFEGTGKYAGAAGGIIIDFNGVSVRVGSGLSDVQRFSWLDNPDDIIGRTAEVAFQEITPDGSMRHPRLVTLRGDK